MKRASPNLAVAAALLALSLACHSSSKQAEAVGDIFVNGFTDGIVPQTFSGVPASATMAVDTAEHHEGASSLRFEVPATDYTGWVLPTSTARDLSGYNALTFWVKASKAATLNAVGFGNDNTGTSLFSVERHGVPLTTTWTKHVLPIPLASKLTAETGLFHMAEGSDEGAYTIWFDEIKFEKLTAAELGAVSAAMDDVTAAVAVGDTRAVAGARATAAVGSVDVTVSVDPRWFTYTSSNEAVATVSAAGVATAVAQGTANVTATLGTAPVTGTLALTVGVAQAPTAAAAAPTAAAADVISLYTSSGTYTNHAVDTWGTDWSNGGQGPHLTDVALTGGTVKKYASLDFVGIEFTGANLVDASQMTHFHVSLWTPNATSFRVKLVDFGADGAYTGSDNTEAYVDLDSSTTPALTQGGWLELDIPMSAFLANNAGWNRAHLAQLIYAAQPTAAATVYVDNVYFHK